MVGDLIPSAHQTGISPKLAGGSKEPASAHLEGWRFGEASAFPLASGERRWMVGREGIEPPTLCV